MIGGVDKCVEVTDAMMRIIKDYYKKEKEYGLDRLSCGNNQREREREMKKSITKSIIKNDKLYICVR